MSDLIERLRDRGVCSIHHNSCRNDMVCEEAISALEAKDAEIARLREDRDRLWYVLEGVAGAIDTGRNEPLVIWREQIEIARAALAEGENNE
jgi:hypothetical protein